MLDTREASKILGVRENASRDEVERKFAILLKKQRIAGSEAGGDGSEVGIDQVAKAYNLLMGYAEEPSAEEESKPNPLLQKMGVDEKKTRNFFYYYKYHILIGFVVLITLAFTLKSCITRVDPDFNIAFIGEFYYSETDGFKQAIRDRVPEIKEPGIDGAILAANMDGQQEYAMQTKAMILFAAGDVDVFILDKVNFEKFAKQGAFVNLDGLTDKLKIDMEKNKDHILAPEESQEKHLFGVDLGDNPVFKDNGIAGKEKIAAIGVRTKNYDKAVGLLEAFLK